MHTFERLWSEVRDVGTSSRKAGIHRITGSRADFELREWFTAMAAARGLTVTVDQAANMWAWSSPPTNQAADQQRALVLGSHLDSVPGGGRFDGLLGLVSAFAALDGLSARGERLSTPIAVVAFFEEEGARFGITCLGSRILTGDLDPAAALARRDQDGTTLAEALSAMGVAPEHFGPDPEALGNVGRYVELHIEQGRSLIEQGRAVAVGSRIRAYGRWALTIEGEANHAGTTHLTERRDPMMTLASLIYQARRDGLNHGCIATIGKVVVEPNAANAIPARVLAWLDARGSDPAQVRAIADAMARTPAVQSVEEFFTPPEEFDAELSAFLARVLGDAPLLESGAGHDAGVLATHGVSSTMLFVRNPTGVSHSPEEYAEVSDCIAGVEALECVVRALDGREGRGYSTIRLSRAALPCVPVHEARD